MGDLRLFLFGKRKLKRIREKQNEVIQRFMTEVDNCNTYSDIEHLFVKMYSENVLFGYSVERIVFNINSNKNKKDKYTYDNLNLTFYFKELSDIDIKYSYFSIDFMEKGNIACISQGPIYDKSEIPRKRKGIDFEDDFEFYKDELLRVYGDKYYSNGVKEKWSCVYFIENKYLYSIDKKLVRFDDFRFNVYFGSCLVESGFYSPNHLLDFANKCPYCFK